MKQPLATSFESENGHTRSQKHNQLTFNLQPKVFEIKDTTVKNIGRTKSFPPGTRRSKVWLDDCLYLRVVLPVRSKFLAKMRTEK